MSERGLSDEVIVARAAVAVARRRPGPGLIHHSDQGSQGSKWLSQRLIERSCDGQAGWVDDGVDGSGAGEAVAST
jgi:transposase InsO family protein